MSRNGKVGSSRTSTISESNPSSAPHITAVNSTICSPRNPNLSKNGNLLPIHDDNGVPMWGMDMIMKCDQCNESISSLDGKILHQLPLDISGGYPVEFKYALHRTHLSKGLSRKMALDFETTGNGNDMSLNLFELANIMFHERRLQYYSSLGRHAHATPPPEFVTFSEFVGTALPSPGVLRDRFDAAAQSDLTLSKMSENERHDRELQSVSCSKGFAEDHTFQVKKNYSDKGPVGGWGANVETGETRSVVLVPSTKQSDYAHAAEAMARQLDFKPKGKWSDIYPSGGELWKELYGDDLYQRLGMYHFVARIAETLDPKHPDYWIALRGLERCVWDVCENEENRIRRKLRDGSLNGKKHTNEQIDAIYYSSKWRSRYGCNIPRYPLEGPTINDKLDLWRIRYKVTASPGAAPAQGREVNGRKLFTPETKDAVENAKAVTGYLQDFLSREEVYIPLNKSAQSNGLQNFRTIRPESNLENSWDSLANYANGGMRPSLADAITKQGICLSNKRIRTSLHVGSFSPEEISKIPSHLRDHPGLYDDTIKIKENELAKALGMEPPNDESCLQVYRPNTGEKFLHEYYEEQVKRNKDVTLRRTTDSARCPCKSCAGNPVLLPHLQDHDESINDHGSDNGGDETMCLPCSDYNDINSETEPSSLPFIPKLPPCDSKLTCQPQEQQQLQQLQHPDPYQQQHMYQLQCLYQQPYLYQQHQLYQASFQNEISASTVAVGGCCETYVKDHVHNENRKRGPPRHCASCPEKERIKAKKIATRKENKLH